MRFSVPIEDSDDPGFVVLLDSLVSAVVASHKPTNVWLIRIDNWFDHKWLKFSGYGLVASDIPLDRWDTVKAEFHQEKITFPPFTPNRVISQCSYVRKGEAYCEAALQFLPHRTDRRHTSASLQKRVGDFANSAVFVWFSSNTVANGKGSVTVYCVMDQSAECWFAAFWREDCSWKLASTRGTSRSYVERLLR
jgi:hypothetical protein